MRQCGGLSYRLLDSVVLTILSQHHSTALPSPKRYDKRYEETFPENICPHHQPRGHGGPGDVEVQDTGYLTNLSVDHEHISPQRALRGLLTASVAILIEVPCPLLDGRTFEAA